MSERGGEPGGVARAVCGVMLAVGALVIFIRRGSSEPQWSDFELLLALVIPAALLFAVAVAGRRGVGSGPADPSRGVLMVSAVLLSPPAIFQFLVWAGASTHHLLYDAAALAASAAIAFAGARRADAPYVVFLAGLALLGTWILVWLKILGHASPEDVRWILLSGGAALAIAAGTLSLVGATGSAELGTAGGLGAVLAGVQGVLVGVVDPFEVLAVGAVNERGNGLATRTAQPSQQTTLVHHLPGAQSLGWDVYLLLISLLLVTYGSRSRRRGPAYVGFLGLVGFLMSVGSQLTRLESGHSPNGSLIGWPLFLVLVGLAGLAAPYLRRARG